MEETEISEEDELWFPHCPKSMHTELPHYKYGLWYGKGRVESWRTREILTRGAVIITFF